MAPYPHALMNLLKLVKCLAFQRCGALQLQLCGVAAQVHVDGCLRRLLRIVRDHRIVECIDSSVVMMEVCAECRRCIQRIFGSCRGRAK